MALPIIPLLAVAALVGLALHKSSQQQTTTTTTTTEGGGTSFGGSSSSSSSPQTTAPAAGTVTLPTTTITGSAATTPAAQTQNGVAPWDNGTMVMPNLQDLPGIPANYAAQSQETVAVQTALNNWASATGFQATDVNGANFVPLKEDGLYGANTQWVAAGFQVYENSTKNAGLKVDGLAGPATQTYLGQWATITKPPSGGY